MIIILLFIIYNLIIAKNEKERNLKIDLRSRKSQMRSNSKFGLKNRLIISHWLIILRFILSFIIKKHTRFKLYSHLPDVTLGQMGSNQLKSLFLLKTFWNDVISNFWLRLYIFLWTLIVFFSRVLTRGQLGSFWVEF